MRLTDAGSSKRNVTGRATTARAWRALSRTRVLLGRRQKRASAARFLDQRLDLARRVRMMVGEIVRGDDLRPDPAQGGVEFLRSRDAGEGDDLASDQGAAASASGSRLARMSGLPRAKAAIRDAAASSPPSTISACTNGS